MVKSLAALGFSKTLAEKCPACGKWRGFYKAENGETFCLRCPHEHLHTATRDRLDVDSYRDRTLRR